MAETGAKQPISSENTSARLGGLWRPRTLAVEWGTGALAVGSADGLVALVDPDTGAVLDLALSGSPRRTVTPADLASLAAKPSGDAGVQELAELVQLWLGARFAAEVVLGGGKSAAGGRYDIGL